ncbi:MAG TPA: VWA domain-containing protein [Bacteroidia bacterium]|nr:VWA domain-containing protein [Bacteroidia bacterium]
MPELILYRFRKPKLVLIFVFALLQSFSSSQVNNRILFIFDDSFSMNGPWNSNIKIEVAKKVMGEFLDSLKNLPDLELALRCYGHTTFFRPDRNCEDTKLEVPFGPAKTNTSKIKARINQLQPMGTTPIAYSLAQCINDFGPAKNSRNIVILITDGIEECNGNPCQVSIDMQKKGIFLRPFVIGVGLDVKFADVFACMGKFYDVSNEANFSDVLKLVLTESLSQTTVEVDLLDSFKKATETDVNMTFYKAGSNLVKYNYLHTINHRGNPDTLVLDPDINYDLVVHTIPPLEKKNIHIERGKHNIISLDAPQGYLKLELDGTNSNYYPTTLVRQGADMQTLNVQEFGKTEKYITGKYQLEILTLPRILLSEVEIKQSSTNTIRIPASASVYFNKNSKGFGSVYLDNGKTLTWVCNLNSNTGTEIIYLQPGRYKVVFRSEFEQVSTKTSEQNFEVKAGASTTIRLL